MDWMIKPCPAPDHNIHQQAMAHQSQLTKPNGSLGELETLACQFAAWQSKLKPSCEAVQIRIFAADHGVCSHRISAYPQAVTAQMVQNFCAGGAAISVLAAQLRADFAAVNLGTVQETPDHPLLVNARIMAGTRDFTRTSAMSKQELENALLCGRSQINTDSDLFIAGDMGIGNTTSAAALYSVLLDLPPSECVGPGTGLDIAGVINKAAIVEKGIKLHRPTREHAFSLLANLGGLEIAAITAAYIYCAQNKVPVLIDGYICTAAALMAVTINPSCRDWMLFAHLSAEPAHRMALDFLNAKPLLALGMRLGEGSGAAAAVSLVRTALELHNRMASFEAAGVSHAE